MLLPSQTLDDDLDLARKYGSLVATSCSTSSSSSSPSTFSRCYLSDTQPLLFNCTAWPAGTTARLCAFG